MSSDTSPPQRYQLERPAESRRQTPDNPSWVKVIGTTLRLWLKRHVLHVPDQRKISNLGRAGLGAAAVLIALAVGAAVVVTVAHVGKGAARTPNTSARKAAHHARPPLTAAQLTARANARAAATWFAAQVSQQAVVGCDPVMCGYLATAGFPAGQQYVLRPGTLLPGSATVIVATGTVRGQYGAQLGGNAPAVIAAFGTGSESVQVRVIASGGASAYQQDASGALAARRKEGRALVADPRVHVRGVARRELTAGLVDPRLMVVLHRLALSHEVDIALFADSGPLADPSTPLRLAEINGLVIKRGRRLVSQVASVLTVLQHQGAPYHPAFTTTNLPGGNVVVSIEFPAPSPS